MYRNWFRYGDTEVANNTRVSKYVENGLKPVGAVVPRCDDCPDIWEALGEDEYDTPALDGAPWYTPSDPDSVDFAGVFVKSVTGLGGSTMQVQVEERVGDGGMVSSRRATSRTIQVTADLVGRTPAATALGLEWLSAALHPPCSESADCAGDILHLFSACPETCDGQTDPDKAPVTADVPVGTLTVERGTSSTITTSARTNLILNPSFELDANADGIADNWGADSAGVNGGITREIRSDLAGLTSGTKVQRIVSSAMDNATGSRAGIATDFMTFAPGAGYARVNVGALILPAGRVARLQINFYNSSNVYISSAVKDATTSGLIENTFTAPAGTAKATMQIGHVGAGTGSATATRVETTWDSALLVQGAPIDYFDGATPSTPAYTYAWTGAANASTSTATGTGTFINFTHTGGATPGRIITGLLPGICDEVTVSWIVNATNVTVVMELLDSTGRVVQETTPTLVNGTRTLSLTVNPTPEFPGDWRTALRVTGSVSARVLTTSRPLLLLDQCVDPYRRTFRNVVTVDGPKVVEERTLGDTTDESSIWTVEWTWVATEPNVWHEPTALLTGVPAKAAGPVAYSAPGIQLSAASNVAVNSTQCARPAPSIISAADNPNLTGLVLPPQPPALSDPNVMNLAGTNYTRRFLEIPASLMPAGLGMLSWVFANDAKAKLGVRVRIYRKGIDPAFVMEPECSFVQEFYIDYLKAGHILYLDGPTGEVYVQTGTDAYGNPIYAVSSRNVRGTYGGPFMPDPVGCADGYVISVDVPNTYTATGGSEYTSGAVQGDLTWSLDLTRRG